MKDGERSKVRTQRAYDYLRESEVIPEVSEEEEEAIVAHALNDYEEKSQEAYGGRNQRMVTVDLNRIALLKKYLDGEDEQTIQEYLAKEGRKQYEDFDSLLETNLNYYVKLLKSRKKSPEPLDLKLQTMVEVDTAKLLNLYSVIFELIKDPRAKLMQEGHGGQLLLAFNLVKEPVGTPYRVVTTAITQATSQLRLHAQLHNKHEIEHDDATQEGLEYIKRITESGIELIPIRQLARAKVFDTSEGYEERLADMEKYIGDRIARGLIAIYGSDWQASG